MGDHPTPSTFFLYSTAEDYALHNSNMVAADLKALEKRVATLESELKSLQENVRRLVMITTTEF